MSGGNTIDRWRRVEEIFHQILEAPAESRAERLSALCADDPTLAAEVSSLLAAESEVESASPARAAAVDPWLGRRVGSFRIEHLIGRGGMGAVYLAKRVDGVFDQKAAVKIVFTRLTSTWHRERFLAERQMLAMLNHPNIAKLIGGGLTDDGEPYLVMEYIEGRRLDTYCQETNAGVEQIVQLALQLCAAVSYAHQHLIVHRDLKPGNVLVTAEGLVKLLDFGTARLMSEDRGGPQGTRLGMRAFTPEYASPEQMFGEPVNMASDIYSLGVVLYRLLTGQLPYAITAGSAAAMVRSIYDAEPVTPSDAVTRVVPEGQLAPPVLRREIRGELDAVILKALRPIPSDRYASVDELAADLQRFLDHRPVKALEGSFSYRARKWFRRNGVSAVAAGLVGLALLGGAWNVVRQGKIAAEEEQRAREGTAEVRKLSRLLLVDFYNEVKQVPGSAAVQRQLVAQAQSYLGRLAHESSEDPDTLFDLVEAYRKSADLLGNPYEENLGDTDAAMKSYREGLAVAERLRKLEPSSVRVVQAAALLHRGMAETLFSTNQVREALQYGQQAADAMAGLAARPGIPIDLISEAAATFDTLGDQYGLRGAGSLGDFRRAEENYRRAEALQRHALERDPHWLRARRGLAIVAMKIGNLHSETDPGRAVEEFRKGLAAFDQIPAAERQRAVMQRARASLLTRLGATLQNDGHAAESLVPLMEARDSYRAVLLLDHSDRRARLDLAIIMNFLGAAFRDLRRYDESLAAYDELNSLLANPGSSLWLGHQAHAIAERARTLEAMGRTAEAAQAMTLGVQRTLAVVADKDASPNDLNRAVRLLLEAKPEHLRDPAKAVELAQRGVKLTGGTDPVYLFRLAEAQAAAGSGEEAKVTLGQTLARLPAPSLLRSQAEAALARLNSPGSAPKAAPKP